MPVKVKRPRAGARPAKKKRTGARLNSRSVCIIGAGRLGTALARALAARGYLIKALFARSRAHARRAAKFLDQKPLPFALAQAELDQLPPCELIFITTPDDSIAEVASELARVLKTDNWTSKRPFVLHASGALSSNILSVLRERGFRTGSMHPLVSVSEPVAGALSLRGAFYCVEGERAAVAQARAIVRQLGGHSFSLDARDKALYHAAAVMASGHVVALLDIALMMLARCGLSRREARAVLLPLLRSTLDNLSRNEPARALTGTFARADAITVRRHLERLAAPDLSEALAAYVLLGQRSLRLAEENGLDRSLLNQIARALEKARR